MTELEVILALNPIESEVLNILYNADNFTTSDLQGAIEVQIRKAYQLGKNVNN